MAMSTAEKQHSLLASSLRVDVVLVLETICQQLDAFSPSSLSLVSPTNPIIRSCRLH
jgi:hypothetical protein